MRWLKKRRHLRDKLAAAEQAAGERAVEAEKIREDALASESLVDRVHARNMQLRHRNSWAAVVADVMGTTTRSAGGRNG